jgi:hypothetical protein
VDASGFLTLACAQRWWAVKKKRELLPGRALAARDLLSGDVAVWNPNRRAGILTSFPFERSGGVMMIRVEGRG